MSKMPDEAGAIEVAAPGRPFCAGHLSKGNVRSWKHGLSKIFF